MSFVINSPQTAFASNASKAIPNVSDFSRHYFDWTIQSKQTETCLRCTTSNEINRKWWRELLAHEAENKAACQCRMTTRCWSCCCCCCLRHVARSELRDVSQHQLPFVCMGPFCLACNRIVLQNETIFGDPKCRSSFSASTLHEAASHLAKRDIVW